MMFSVNARSVGRLTRSRADAHQMKRVRKAKVIKRSMGFSKEARKAGNQQLSVASHPACPPAFLHSLVDMSHGGRAAGPMEMWL